MPERLWHADMHAAFRPVPLRWKVFIALSLPALLGSALAACLPAAFPALAFTRAGIFGGEFWRLFTGHFIHVGVAHLALNLAGLALLCELLGGQLSLRRAAGLVTAGVIGIDLMLLVLAPAVGWYAGLSGLLHALWAGCALFGACHATPLRGLAAVAPDDADRRGIVRDRPGRDQLLCVAALLLLAGKLLVEAGAGGVIHTDSAAAQLIGVPVVVVAHRYGAVSGLLYALLSETGGRWYRFAAPNVASRGPARDPGGTGP